VNHRALYVLGNTVLQDGFLAGNLMEGGLAAVLVQLPVSVEGIAAVAHDLAGLRHVAQLLGQF
jgi:hypothetical protein